MAKDEHDHHNHEEHKEHKEHNKHEEHGSHEHGAAHLTMAVGVDGLEIMLETPAANVFGFEHKAKSAEDKKQLKTKKAVLENVNELFNVNPEAACVSAKTEIKSSLLNEHDHHHGDSEESHSDVDAHWTFKCKNTAALKNVSVSLFSAFPNGFEQIKVDWVSTISASTVTLKKDGVVEFSK